jgi:DNA mismatch endonuclease (patch repair protein)
MDNLVSQQRSKIMRAIKSKNTKSEVILAKTLWHKGYRYRKHDKTLIGTPDLTFRKYKIAIFIDSEFFHGKDWHTLEQRLKTRKEFWKDKIQRNMAKDIHVNEALTLKGWKVLRFWDEEVKKSLYKTVHIIEKMIDEARSIINYK